MDILNQFGVQPVLLLAQVVNFLILLFILKRFLYKPILKVLDERKKRIEDSLKNAEEIERRLIEIASKEAESILRSAREGEKIIKQAGIQGAQIIEDANKSAEQIVKKAAIQAQELMIQEKISFQQTLREHIADLILLIVQKVTGKTLTKHDEKRIAQDAIKSLKS